jgi:hypothetical protein
MAGCAHLEGLRDCRQGWREETAILQDPWVNIDAIHAIALLSAKRPEGAAALGVGWPPNI